MIKRRKMQITASIICLVLVLSFTGCKRTSNTYKSSSNYSINNLKKTGTSQKTNVPSKVSVNSGQAIADSIQKNANENTAYIGLNAKINEIARKYKAVGMTVAVIRNGKIDWVTSYGYADKEKGVPATHDTAYRIASISKTVSAMVLMTLWDKDLVDLDKDIGYYLGFPVRNPKYPDKPITVRSLLIHTSSISDYGTYNSVVDSGAEYPPLKNMLTPGYPYYNSKNFHQYAPGLNHFDYSNFGAGIIAAIVESITGKRFNDYAIESVFSPLGIDAGYLPNDIKNPDRIANIYCGGTLSYGKVQAFEEKNKISKLPIGQNYRMAQGNLYISAEDLSKLTIVLMEQGVYEGKRVLSGQATDMINKVQWTGSSGFNKVRGLGLLITDDLVKGRRLRGHQGRAYGATNEMFYDINDKTGVVYLSNGTKDVKASNGFTGVGSEIVNAAYDTIDKMH